MIQAKQIQHQFKDLKQVYFVFLKHCWLLQSWWVKTSVPLKYLSEMYAQMSYNNRNSLYCLQAHSIVSIDWYTCTVADQKKKTKVIVEILLPHNGIKQWSVNISINFSQIFSDRKCSNIYLFCPNPRVDKGVQRAQNSL